MINAGQFKIEARGSWRYLGLLRFRGNALIFARIKRELRANMSFRKSHAYFEFRRSKHSLPINNELRGTRMRDSRIIRSAERMRQIL
jgi:hypothetical protein